jgi:hypothetical protein
MKFYSTLMLLSTFHYLDHSTAFTSTCRKRLCISKHHAAGCSGVSHYSWVPYSVIDPPRTRSIGAIINVPRRGRKPSLQSLPKRSPSPSITSTQRIPRKEEQQNSKHIPDCPQNFERYRSYVLGRPRLRSARMPIRSRNETLSTEQLYVLSAKKQGSALHGASASVGELSGNVPRARKPPG